MFPDPLFWFSDLSFCCLNRTHWSQYLCVLNSFANDVKWRFRNFFRIRHFVALARKADVSTIWCLIQLLNSVHCARVHVQMCVHCAKIGYFWRFSSYFYDIWTLLNKLIVRKQSTGTVFLTSRIPPLASSYQKAVDVYVRTVFILILSGRYPWLAFCLVHGRSSAILLEDKSGILFSWEI